MSKEDYEWYETGLGISSTFRRFFLKMIDEHNKLLEEQNKLLRELVENTKPQNITSSIRHDRINQLKNVFEDNLKE